ncbi:cyclic nucleotide-binding domain-containing protein [Amycolatopsis alkalitolerans]|uniref:Cyclic nucleotide-binding domain-containing protein n=2 Tax=Amycolatopsis alkalitolerans TaxID=2547244 RepID=A0A5C4LXE1_9PSEU|nr:cyclic nucleotide-binding domain-containing protein [Amycolatopsis alkalitolerans]
MATNPAFARLTPAEQEVIAASAHEVRYHTGERMLTAGEPAESCWLIHSGQIALTCAVPGRGDVVIQTLGPGEIVGWSWLVPPYRWHFDATATEDTVATELTAERLRAVAAHDPAFGYSLTRALFELLAHRLQATRARLLDLYDGAHS